MRQSLLSLSAVTALILLTACGEPPTTVEDLHTLGVVLPNGKKIVAEAMQTESDMLRGMMFRDSLAEDRGMLFTHGKEAKYPYWMYNVRIPLDIIWMDRGRHVVEISANTPPCPSKSASACPTFGGHFNAQYVLELNGGSAAKNSVKLGDVIGF